MPLIGSGKNATIGVPRVHLLRFFYLRPSPSMPSDCIFSVACHWLGISSGFHALFDVTVVKAVSIIPCWLKRIKWSLLSVFKCAKSNLR
jgi:hypothetical protein